MDGPAHIKAEHQEFLINLRVAEHNNPDGAPFAMAGNHVMVYGAYASAPLEMACRSKHAAAGLLLHRRPTRLRDQVTRRSAEG